MSEQEQAAQNACDEVGRLLMDMEVPLRELRNLLNVVAMTAEYLCSNSTTEFEGNGLHTLYSTMDSRAKVVSRLWCEASDASRLEYVPTVAGAQDDV
ncbi:hypothetical protein [Pelagibius sp. Alg239-R121]|uniref:hypothetical protein n=1 Tax=Pelagibius sp. Alg239-R121 TaxID=2993448 RepID=UPI0024A6B707|nr:hypothetical protein [Pelagibius sp. Alg239-R121]